MNVLGTILISLAAGALPTALITGFFMFKVNRAQATKLLAEAENVSRNTALDEAKAAVEFSHKAFESVKEQCLACQERLSLTEERLQRSEQRMHLSEERMLESERRERRVLATLRAIVRVMDDNDPTQIEAVITAARELL